MMDEVGNNASPAPVEGESAPEAVNDAAVSPAEVSVPENAPLAAAAPPPAPVVPVETPPVLPRIRLDKKHPLAIRWMHWINFPVLFTMIWSGLLIYWNDSDNAYKHPHAVYRVGVGSFTLVRFFPHWFWMAMNAPYHVTEGLGYHFFFAWIFAINGLLYVLFTILSGEWRFVVPDRKSMIQAIQVTLKDLHLSKYLPPQTKYNGAQKIAYTSVILMGAGSLLTGLAIYKPTQAHWLTTLLGGYEMARWEHLVLAGWNNFRSMVSGLEVKSIQEPSIEAERKSWG
jgi:thiosulfate reductase cytochrome b subunit